MFVVLTPLTDESTERLLALAVEQADPVDVMPPVPGPPGWTDERRAAFRAFHRSLGPGGDTVLYGIELDGAIVGMIRLRLTGPGVAETGMWLGRGARSKGVGLDALRALLAIAAERGVRLVRAETTPDNTAAVRALARVGARLTTTPTVVSAEIELPA